MLRRSSLGRPMSEFRGGRACVARASTFADVAIVGVCGFVKCDGVDRRPCGELERSRRVDVDRYGSRLARAAAALILFWM
jgi:hypothetical protein